MAIIDAQRPQIDQIDALAARCPPNASVCGVAAHESPRRLATTSWQLPGVLPFGPAGVDGRRQHMDGDCRAEAAVLGLGGTSSPARNSGESGARVLGCSLLRLNKSGPYGVS
jgi:hypothetical protein